MSNENIDMEDISKQDKSQNGNRGNIAQNKNEGKNNGKNGSQNGNRGNIAQNGNEGKENGENVAQNENEGKKNGKNVAQNGNEGKENGGNESRGEGQRGTEGKKTKKKGRKGLVAAIIIVLVVAVGLGLFYGGRYYTDNKAVNFTKSYTLYVYPDMTVGQVIDSLVTGGAALRRGSILRCASKEELDERLHAGKYQIDSAFTSIYVVRMLCNGWQTPHNLTLSGTLRTKGKLAETIGRQMMTDSATVADLLNDDDFLSTLGFVAEDVFGLFLPDTYEMYWTTPADEIFVRFREEYDKFWTQERLDKAKKQGLSQKEVSVLASIVSGETLKTDEYPIIAGVYLNRLHKGMLLQADPTIAFIFDYKLDRILTAHTKVDSPYNTYKHKGLPPAPINVPPKACIDAVLDPAVHNYIYFCASPDFNGGHRFATTYSEHLRNAQEFHRALTKRNAERAAAAAAEKK